MKKRQMLLAVLLSAAVLGGCQQTPKEQIVRQKGQESIENYKEADPDEDRAEAGTDEEKASGENALAKRLEVPKTYQAQDQSEDGIYTMEADASVQVPDVEKIGIYPVTIREMTPELMMTFHRAFFGDAVIYEGNQYFEMTKDQIREKIDELKAYQAAGNLDPWGILADFREQDGDSEVDPDEIYNIQTEIDGWESRYAEAPEKNIRQEVTPAFGLEVPGTDAEWTADRFSGAVETEDGVFSCVYMRNHASDKGYLSIGRQTENGSIVNASLWGDGGYDRYESAAEEEASGPILSREEAEKMAGITADEAQAVGDAYVEKLGDDGLQCSAVRLCTRMMDADGTQMASASDAGYRLYYTRTVDGFPTTYETNPGGGLESMDSTNDVAGYEKLTIVVNKNGLQCAEFTNWSQVGEKQVDSVQMKSFPEIADIFEQMLKMQNADKGEYMKKTHYQVKEARLGYGRIYDPGKDIMQGLLVPVWDFFGIWESTFVGDGEEYNSVVADPYQSFLTVNAVDGTIIERSLGY